ncbi:2-amino-4-hydroxy-6-hydroxymethyldihydropteridine diphosphokinase [Bacillus infantis]|uniref:2-amino-4-hydroxy-6- hydroxymethyldihydropteridine diphosphokinase n=1 Tax=Bacillus infantis TaxID=324767 RepID=UPI003CE9D07C
MENRAFIALGSNMGDRAANLREAIQMLSEHPGIDLASYSSIYETDPLGYEDQGEFLNMVIAADTDRSPHELLEVCMSIEQRIGRKRDIRWGPRTIDLDILLYNHENMITEDLIIPHPRMKERAFVIVPLAEIGERTDVPGMDTPLEALLEEIPDREGVRIWKQKNGEDVFGLFEN